MADMWILFRSIDSVARGLGGPWTWWIGSAPVQMSGCCLGATLSWLHDGLLAGVGCSSLTLRFSWTVTLIILGLGFLRAHLLWLCCPAAFPPIFLQLRKGPLWSCAELLQSYTLCSFDQYRTVKLRLPAVRDLFWGMLGRGDGGCRGIDFSGSGYNEVLALEVQNVAWLRRTKETCKASCVCNGSWRVSLPRRRSRRACVRSYVHFACVCVYMCMCVYVYVCGHVYMYIYACVYVFIHLCVYTHVCVYVYAYLCIDCGSQYQCFSMWTVSCMRMCFRVHMYAYTYVCRYLYMCIFLQWVLHALYRCFGH